MATFGHGVDLHGPYVLVDTETTGFSPAQGDRIIEVAALRIDENGEVQDEFCTLVNPEGRDVGPTFVHGITNSAVRDAPTFGEISAELARRFSGAVLVAHNAQFDEKFLAAEFARVHQPMPLLPGLCSLWLARKTLDLPNYKLQMIGRHFGTGAAASHSALGDVRTLSVALPRMLSIQQQQIRYPVGTATAVAPVPRNVRIVTRAPGQRKGDKGWMPDLLDRLPLQGIDVTEPVADAYAEALTAALSDGRITGDEARHLARIAGQAGLGAVQVRDLNGAFLEGLREAAFADDVLTGDELRNLVRAATALGMPDYFDDLSVTTQTPASLSPGGPAPRRAIPETETRQRRCSYCRQPGHYRPKCPQLAGVCRRNRSWRRAV